MALALSHVILPIALAFSAPGCAWAQHISAPPEVGNVGASASATAAQNVVNAFALPEARVQEIRRELSRTRDGEQRYTLLMELVRGYFRDGRVAESLQVRDEIVGDAAIPAGRRSLAASELAMSLSLVGEYARSEQLVERARSLARDTSAAELETLPREPAYAFLAAEAEIDNRFLNRHDLALLKSREHSELAWTNLNNPSLSDRRHRAAATELLNNIVGLTRLLIQNDRHAEALSYVNEISAYLTSRPDLRATPYQRAGVDFARALALCSFDDYDAALAAIDSSISGYRSAGVPEYEVGYGGALRIRLMIALVMGRIGQYQSDAQSLERGRAVNPVLAGSFPAQEAESLSMASRGQWASASARIGEAMEQTLRTQGAGSPFYKYQAAMQVLYRLNDPAGNMSDADIERYVQPLAGSRDDWADASAHGYYVEDGALVASMDRLMRSDGSAQSQALAFRIAELLQMNATQGIMIDGAARLAAGTPQLRALIEKEQILRYDQDTSRASFARAVAQLDRLTAQSKTDPTDIKRQSDDAAEKEQALRNATADLRRLHREIDAQFPTYRELIAPAIPTPAALGKVLHPKEVYIDLYAGRQASYGYAVLPGGDLHAWRLDITREQVRKMALALRAGFDSARPPQTPGDLAGFGIAAAAGLFQALIAPMQSALQDATTVYLSTSGVLASVPFDVLITRPATTLADADWWIARVIPVQMPSASALVLARSQPAAHARQPLIAFADPSFDGSPHAPVEDGPLQSVRGQPVATAGYADDFDYRRVRRLPETLEEAQAIARALGAPAQSVIRDTQATRSTVLKEDLSDTRVILFATHGITAGELPGMRKAGLALGYEGAGLHDSVLTIDDIVALRLNADWVVLSACNTGYASGDAGDAVSALARGFFAAGARSVLVTQWAVESQSAKQLMVGLFDTYAANPTLSKADALARTQRNMLDGRDGALYRHPYFWGAYFLAGDAQR
ncbi:CHAT domain-containing protein [Trinickia mobilis]|uniref:CHAT domain-containing protein n=1 Tax=Trinickia mobilis TaxID=2816356 RepID=UPI001A90B29C|nr:CHAT domain-containing protein [Trinickia mobilis]